MSTVIWTLLWWDSELPFPRGIRVNDITLLILMTSTREEPPPPQLDPQAKCWTRQPPVPDKEAHVDSSYDKVTLVAMARQKENHLWSSLATFSCPSRSLVPLLEACMIFPSLYKRDDLALSVNRESELCWPVNEEKGIRVSFGPLWGEAKEGMGTEIKHLHSWAIRRSCGSVIGLY